MWTLHVWRNMNRATDDILPARLCVWVMCAQLDDTHSMHVNPWSNMCGCWKLNFDFLCRCWMTRNAEETRAETDKNCMHTGTCTSTSISSSISGKKYQDEWKSDLSTVLHQSVFIANPVVPYTAFEAIAIQHETYAKWFSFCIGWLAGWLAVVQCALTYTLGFRLYAPMYYYHWADRMQKCNYSGSCITY